MEGSVKEVVLREELDNVYATIAAHIVMLDREFFIIEKFSEGKVRMMREEVIFAVRVEVGDEIPKVQNTSSK